MTEDVIYAAGRDPRLEQRLVLSRYFCRLFGVTDFHELRELVRDQREGVTEDGRTYIGRVLEGLNGLSGVTPDQIANWDGRILSYVDRLNTNRPVPVTLKYFQYLAALLTEIYLDRFSNHRSDLLTDLNSYVDELNASLRGGTPQFVAFTATDLRKLAFWLATGSGKTLLMHIHLWQSVHYCGLPDGSILLITPDEGLSRQHLQEYDRSGISARRYGAEGDLLQGPASVVVLEVTKLTEVKSGGGERVEVASFGERNLVFVDEGHRGATGEVWRGLRRALAERGFTFEYSATLGQVVNGASRAARPPLLDEYAKAILVDYSYPHFHGDGYGKDYWVTNLSESDDEEMSDVVLVGNLVSFFQQVSVFANDPTAFSAYNLEMPLWIFVGHTVTGGSSAADRQSLTDVETIVSFLRRFLQDRTHWAEMIRKVTSEESGVHDVRHRDLFEGHFKQLRATGRQPADIYDDIVANIFRGQPGQELQAVELKGAPGEIGLRLGSGENPYFGVINIGDVAGLIARLDEGGTNTSNDLFSHSIFADINRHDSPVSLLVGSRKFTEGWDSFRVSSMGLMNIGRNEGSQVIQLFGRGVRLWGKDFSLKRSSTVVGSEAPEGLAFLETLNVFGIRANYMGEFRRHLAAEGVPVDTEEVTLPIKVDSSIDKYGLQTLELPGTARFKRDEVVRLDTDGVPRIHIDVRPRIERAREGVDERERAEGSDVGGRLRELAPVLNIDHLYLDLLTFKQTKRFSNIVFGRSDIDAYLGEGNYEVLAIDSLDAGDPASHRRANVLAELVLKKAVTTVFETRRRVWEGTHLRLASLTKDDANLSFGEYVLRASTNNPDFLGNLRAIVTDSAIHQDDEPSVPTIAFDRHLYQPLVIEDSTERVYGSKPASLNRGEADFVERLREQARTGSAALEGRELFLLRNLTRGKGLGLFEPAHGEAFYPDFILWLVSNHEQRVAFVDPKGLRHARGGFSDPKIELHRRLARLSQTLRQAGSNPTVLTSFIVSTTKYRDLAPVFGAGGHAESEFEDEHVLFGEDPTVAAKLLQRLVALPS